MPTDYVKMPGKFVKLSQPTVKKLKWEYSNDPQCEHTGLIKRVLLSKTKRDNFGKQVGQTQWFTAGYRCSSCDAVHYLPTPKGSRGI